MRLQLHKDFTFADAARAVPYLAALGVSHLYASPILTARPGSSHGYDVIDPTQVSAELGGEAGLRALVGVLRSAGLGLIVDIVPNHMAVGTGENAWWQDVLRHGRDSRHARCFDIDWEPADPALHGKVLAPFLGRPYGEALAAGELRLGIDATGTPVVRYFASAWPIEPRDLAEIAALGLDAYDPAAPDGRDRLHRLLERQHYRLAWWGTAGDEINWRRFFDINGLAGLRVEDPAVFRAIHATIFRLYAEGLIDGLRIDHVDGLADPPGYCRALRAALEAAAPARPAAAPSGPAWLVVEKILGAEESLPGDWGVDGTSGYDFMDQVSALQHDAAAGSALGFFWAAVSGRPADFRVEEHAARLETLRRGFDAQLAATASALHVLARLDPVTRDTSQAAIRRGLAGAAGAFPGLSHLQCRRRRALGRRRRRVRPRAASGQGGQPGRAAPGAGPAGPLARRRAPLSARRGLAACRDAALPAAQRAGRRQGGRGHRVLPLRTAAVAQRRGVRRGTAGRLGGRVPCRLPGAARASSPTPCWPPRRTTTSAARTCARASRC